MKKIVIHTQYDPAELKNAHKVFDRHDNVDRLSYVDNTTMIKRFVLEGKSLAEARAKALRSGQYLSQKEALLDDSGLSIPVYAMDPAVAQPIIENATKKLATASVGVDKADFQENESKPTEAGNDSSSAS